MHYLECGIVRLANIRETACAAFDSLAERLDMGLSLSNLLVYLFWSTDLI